MWTYPVIVNDKSLVASFVHVSAITVKCNLNNYQRPFNLNSFKYIVRMFADHIHNLKIKDIALDPPVSLCTWSHHDQSGKMYAES